MPETPANQGPPAAAASCERCGYPLAGPAQPRRCPECGAPTGEARAGSPWQRGEAGLLVNAWRTVRSPGAVFATVRPSLKDGHALLGGYSAVGATGAAATPLVLYFGLFPEIADPPALGVALLSLIAAALIIGLSGVVAFVVLAEATVLALSGVAKWRGWRAGLATMTAVAGHAAAGWALSAPVTVAGSLAFVGAVLLGVRGVPHLGWTLLLAGPTVGVLAFGVLMMVGARACRFVRAAREGGA